MIKPRPVQQGDRIAVVAPASSFARDEFDRGIRELSRLGFDPVFDDRVFATESGYLAGSADMRAATFMTYWDDPRVAALMAVRGGFGSVHILPLLDGARIKANPKLFIAYSDNTSLLSWLTCGCGVTALHGPMLEGRLAGGAAKYDERSFLALARDGRGLELCPDGLVALREGEAAGPLFGGTIANLVASLGTPYAFDPPDGCVLFLEDVNERPFRIDRMNPIVPIEVRDRIAAASGESVPGYASGGTHVKIPAAWLIERAGFNKGYDGGTVAISTKHPLAIVNRGGATARDIVRFASKVKRGVNERFGVWLRPEPVFVGFSTDPDVAYLKRTGP